MKHVYLGRQPIIDNNAKLCAYEIMYRNNKDIIKISDYRYCAASVINSILNKFGTHSLLGNRQAIIKVNESFLLHDIIFTIPNKFFIFSLSKDIEMNERVVERVQRLHDKGYDLAIDNIFLNTKMMQKYKVIYKELSYIKIKLDSTPALGLKQMIKDLHEKNIKVIACNIDDTNKYSLARDLGCDWFQGYFFAEPKIIENAEYAPTQAKILKLYNLLIEDTNIDEITSEFEKNYEITIQLLQFINSGAFHFKKKISSIHHILILVGRIPLSEWLMLMIYSKSISHDNSHPPLLLLVKSRTELMNSILKTIHPQAKSNLLGEAYFVGVLSLIDTIFSVKLEDILNDLNVSKDVKDALLQDAGQLGEIYALIRDIESFHTQNILDFEKKYNLTHDTIEKLLIKSIKDVNLFENPLID